MPNTQETPPLVGFLVFSHGTSNTPEGLADRATAKTLNRPRLIIETSHKP
jgi:hypothetical protein